MKQEVALIKQYGLRFKTQVDRPIGWEEIAEKLAENEIAIEFSHFRLNTLTVQDTEVQYVAYLLKKGWENPKMIPLFKERALQKITPQ